MESPSIADVLGPWVDPELESGLVERCKRHWNVPVSTLPNQILATFLRQGIALQLVIPEARRRLDASINDDSELYEGELAEALKQTKRLSFGDLNLNSPP